MNEALIPICEKIISSVFELDLDSRCEICDFDSQTHGFYFDEEIMGKTIKVYEHIPMLHIQKITKTIDEQISGYMSEREFKEYKERRMVIVDRWAKQIPKESALLYWPGDGDEVDYFCYVDLEKITKEELLALNIYWATELSKCSYYSRPT